MTKEFEFNLWVKYVILGSIVGIIFETTAFFLSLWVFNPWWIFIPWAFFLEGFCFGGAAFLTRTYHPLIQYGVSAGLGCAGEVVYAWLLRFYVFPDEKLLFLQGMPAIIIGLTIIWGFLCPLMTLVINRINRNKKVD